MDLHARRTCAKSGCQRQFIPRSKTHRYCNLHRQTSKADPTAHAGRYGWSHQTLRKAWARKVEAGGVVCVRCGAPISRGEPWDLGHRDGGGRRDWAGPEHQRCNRATNDGRGIEMW